MVRAAGAGYHRPMTPRDGAAEALARLYDVDLLEDPGDLDLYLALAARTGGPLLELGCGTGRLAVALAAAGYAVTGVDRDPAMLARARVSIARGGRDADANLRLVEADIAGLALPDAGSYRLGFIALNSIFLMASRDGQRAALAALAGHLAPGGVAVVDAWQPDADDLARFDGRVMLEYVRDDPESGLQVVKTSSARYDPTSQVVVLTARYEEGAAGRPAVRWVREDRLRLISADELAGLAGDVGLELETLAGSYDLEGIGSGSERAILLAVRV